MIERQLVVTNVTEVKEGKYGPRVTINLYESLHPNPETDIVYMVTLGIKNEILQGIIDQLKITDDIGNKQPGSRIALPTGTRVKISYDDESTSSYNSKVKHLMKINSIHVIGEARERVDRVFQARDVVFKDWGVFIQTMDGEFVDDKYLFLASHVGEKISGLMDRYKVATPADTVHVLGDARLYYATYPADSSATRWLVKAKSRFDSRFDDPGHVKIEMSIDGIKTIYLSKLKKMKSNPEFINAVKMMGQTWTERFVSEKEMIAKGRELKIDFDVNLMPSIFLEAEDRDAFYSLKSMLSNDYDVYFHAKNEFKYVVLHDTGTNDFYQKRNREPAFYKIIVLDAKFKTIYLFTSNKIPVATFLEKVRVNDDFLFLENAVKDDGNHVLVKKLKIAGNEKKWLEETWNFMLQ
jgi:hypothetical protein